MVEYDADFNRWRWPSRFELKTQFIAFKLKFSFASFGICYVNMVNCEVFPPYLVFAISVCRFVDITALNTSQTYPYIEQSISSKPTNTSVLPTRYWVTKWNKSKSWIFLCRIHWNESNRTNTQQHNSLEVNTGSN